MTNRDIATANRQFNKFLDYLTESGKLTLLPKEDRDELFEHWTSVFFNSLLKEQIKLSVPITNEMLTNIGFYEEGGNMLWYDLNEEKTDYVLREYTEEGSMFFFVYQAFNKGQVKKVCSTADELVNVFHTCGLTELENKLTNEILRTYR